MTMTATRLAAILATDEYRELPGRVFFRVHWRGCPPFSAENAESVEWGGRGQTDPCPRCQGEGQFESGADCPACEGTGEVPVEPLVGYSCCQSPEDLVEYFRQRSEPEDDEEVIVFLGEYQPPPATVSGGGGECLAIPTEVLLRTTWREFRAAVEEAAQQPKRKRGEQR